MKQVLAVGMLMVCALAAHAQLMGPGYMMGNQQEKINHPKAAKIYKALYEAADRNDCATFKELLDTGIDPNMVVKEKDGVEIIWYIPESRDCIHDGEDVIHPLIPAKVCAHRDLGTRNHYLYHLAIRAAERGNLCILKELHEHHFNWRFPDGGFREAFLEVAFAEKRLEVMRYLLSLPEFQRYKDWDWEERLQKLEAEVEEAKAKAAKAQQRTVQAEVQQSLQKKK